MWRFGDALVDIDQSGEFVGQSRHLGDELVGGQSGCGRG